MKQTTSWTNNEEFERQGYICIKNLLDPDKYSTEIPGQFRGSLWYRPKQNNPEFSILKPSILETPDSFCRYDHPIYRYLHRSLGRKIENIIGRSVYPSYYAEMFYFGGDDRKGVKKDGGCEITLTILINTSSNKSWPIWMENPRGLKRSVKLTRGDALLYKGCDIVSWRKTMPEGCWHEVSFYYVLQDGIRAHHAFAQDPHYNLTLIRINK